MLANATIVVSGSRITEIDTAGSKPADIDLGQSTVLPGLIDVHSHIGWHFGSNGRYEPRAATPAQDVLYAAENAYVTLMAGFTTIQSPGQPGDVDLRDAIARGVLPGPRVLSRSCRSRPRPARRSSAPDGSRAETSARRRRQNHRRRRWSRWRRTGDVGRTMAGGLRRSTGSGVADDGARTDDGVGEGRDRGRLHPD